MSASVNTSNGNKKKVRSKKMNLTVDMAPMCDLGFLLITFFMFTTTFNKPNIMHLTMPAKSDDTEMMNEDIPRILPQNSLTIILGKDNKAFWYQQDLEDLNLNTLIETNYSKDGIRKAIIEAYNNAPDQGFFTVLIKPTDDSRYENVVNVLDEMQITDTKKYSISDITKKEQEIYQEKVK